MRSIVSWIVVLAAAWGLYRFGTDPYRTPLPLDVADLSVIEPQLARLPADDRQLVLDYLRRSGGDVLPAQFADPDEPLTARTFAEAIELETEFQKKDQAFQAELRAQRARYEERFDPLRAVVGARIVRRERLSDAEADATPPQSTAIRKSASADAEPAAPHLYLTYRLLNLGMRDIVSIKGKLEVPGHGLMTAADCWIDDDVALPARGFRDVRCQVGRRIDAIDQAMLERAIETIPLYWRPEFIRFSDGAELSAPP